MCRDSSSTYTRFEKRFAFFRFPSRRDVGQGCRAPFCSPHLYSGTRTFGATFYGGQRTQVALRDGGVGGRVMIMASLAFSICSAKSPNLGKMTERLAGQPKPLGEHHHGRMDDLEERFSPGKPFERGGRISHGGLRIRCRWFGHECPSLFYKHPRNIERVFHSTQTETCSHLRPTSHLGDIHPDLSFSSCALDHVGCGPRSWVSIRFRLAGVTAVGGMLTIQEKVARRGASTPDIHLDPPAGSSDSMPATQSASTDGSQRSVDVSIGHVFIKHMGWFGR
ncbi:uncharacterized protein EV422DRAFT_193387 [Fimicolochytrium jonesii]|uniref:uncharacterized protein n=1 Tax=Fimicolochytrium jonesii TaxID=1396493 RepID=UPI0022FEAFF7|nr:uncharacterized protein EV422DRAFT_193387 [Fimicolochytrium jonesii]KAI8818183.1 hypothetical protein EV422DRAFT_193387 [Fimicolochytrium jonesii]